VTTGTNDAGAAEALRELISLMKDHPATVLEVLLRTDFEPEIMPLKRIIVRACVVASVGLRATDEEEPRRIDVQTDHLIAGTWPADKEAQEEVFRAAGLTRRRTRDIIREIFFRPRAFYEPDDVKRMLSINDRLFDEVGDAITLQHDGGKVSLDHMMQILDEVFGMQKIEAALGDDFETFFDPLCRYETVTITAPRYVIAAARWVTDDFVAADVIDKEDLPGMEKEAPGFTDARNYWNTAVDAMRRRIR
jgi:hypothetical protein